MADETETVTVQVKYFLDAEINGVPGVQRSGPFWSSATAATAATALLSRSNVNKVTIVREVE